MRGDILRRVIKIGTCASEAIVDGGTSHRAAVESFYRSTDKNISS